MKHLYLLIVLFSTSFSIQASSRYSELEQQDLQMSTDSIVCDILINGVSIVGFTPLDTIYDVILPYNSPIPPVSIVLCDSTNVVDTLMIDDAVGVPGTSIFYIYTAQGNVTYFINWGYEAPSTDATLDSLYGDIGRFCWGFTFDSAQFSYGWETVIEITTLVNFTVVSTDINATVVFTGSATVAPYGELIITVTAQDGITSQDYNVFVTLECPMGLDENVNDFIDISPVPAKNNVDIHLNTTSSTSLYLVDLSGRVLQSIEIEEGTEDYQLDVSKSPSGMYFIEVHQDGAVLQSEKLIIE